MTCKIGAYKVPCDFRCGCVRRSKAQKDPARNVCQVIGLEGGGDCFGGERTGSGCTPRRDCSSGFDCELTYGARDII
jgi:hypothetical protein